MKLLPTLLLIIVFAISLGSFNPVHASCATSDIPCNDLISNPTVQQSNSTVQYTPLHGSKMEVILDQGQSTTLPVKVSVPPGDKIINLLTSLSPWPDGIYGTVSPQVIQNVLTANMTLQIYVQPYVKPGNYTLNIVAQGWINDTSGNASMVNSGTPISLPVIVQTHTGTLSISLDKMTDIKKESYCYNNGCSTFTSFEKFQLLLKSDVNSTVSLSGPDVPVEKWIHFDPTRVNTGPDGTESIMTIAGMVQSLTGNNPISTKIFTIRTESQDGSTAKVYFPYENNFNMSVLHSAEPINFTLQWTTNISSNNYGTYGVVYDPGDNSSIPVHLSVAGLEQNSQVVPLPSSIDVKINKTSFVLNSSQIYYIPIIVKTSNASVGNQYIVINETIGKKQFLSTLPIYIMPNICLGGPGMCGSQSATGEKNNHADANVVASPLKQFKSGIPASKVVCKQGFQLILKKEDNSPACIKPEDAIKFLAHLWGLPIS